MVRICLCHEMALELVCGAEFLVQLTMQDEPLRSRCNLYCKSGSFHCLIWVVTPKDSPVLAGIWRRLPIGSSLFVFLDTFVATPEVSDSGTTGSLLLEKAPGCDKSISVSMCAPHGLKDTQARDRWLYHLLFFCCHQGSGSWSAAIRTVVLLVMVAHLEIPFAAGRGYARTFWHSHRVRFFHRGIVYKWCTAWFWEYHNNEAPRALPGYCLLVQVSAASAGSG